MKNYLIGTALCVIAAVSVLVIGWLGISHVYAILSILVLLVGFGIQLRELFKIRPSMYPSEPKKNTDLE